MAQIRYQDRPLAAEPGETVLSCLTRHGIAIPSSCQAGACQSCLMRATCGTPPSSSQHGLKDSLRQQGYFLSCMAKPQDDLEVCLPDDDIGLHAPARVAQLDRLSADVVRVRLVCDVPFSYRGGQFLNLVRSDGLVRPYSIASLHGRDEYLELHVRRTPNGNMSRWIHEELEVGERVHVRGPAGDCFYLPGTPDQPILLVGTGTGLAPLLAILEDALRSGHTGSIHLYHGALREEAFYMVDELRSLATLHANVAYTRCIPEGKPLGDVAVGPIDRMVLTAVGNPARWRSYLCGNPELVQSLRKKLFLAGASMKQIHSDAFLAAAKPSAASQKLVAGECRPS